MPRFKNNKPFRVVITELDITNLENLSARGGVPYGIFFTSSGAAWFEPVNPNAQYRYIYRTDEIEPLPLDIRATKEGKKHARKTRKEKDNQ